MANQWTPADVQRFNAAFEDGKRCQDLTLEERLRFADTLIATEFHWKKDPNDRLRAEESLLVPLAALSQALDSLELSYVIEHGVAIILLGRVRATYDIDVLVDEQGFDLELFVTTIKHYGFQVDPSSLSHVNLKGFLTFSYTSNQFKVLLRFARSQFEQDSIDEALMLPVSSGHVRIDHPINAVIKELQSWRTFDIEDALAVMISSYTRIDFDFLKEKATDLGLASKLVTLIDLLTERIGT